MVKVAIWGSLRAATGGKTELEVEATTTKELLDQLAETYPDLKPQIEQGVSLAIDGVIFKEAWFTPINRTSEVVLMPRMAGG